MTDDLRQHRAYADVRGEIRDADLLLFRRRNWYTRLISVAGRSPYVHAAMAGWWKDRLMCVEMTSGGGRAQLLSNIVERWPGACDVYRANAARRRFSRQRTLAAMIAITGKPYGRLNLGRAALLHLPIFRFWFRPTPTTARRPAGRRSARRRFRWPAGPAASIRCPTWPTV